MKIATLAPAVASLLCFSSAELVRRTVQHDHTHPRAVVARRDRLTVTNPAVAAATEVPEVIVYVDQFGNPVRTATETVLYIPAATLSALPTVAAIQPPSPVITVGTSASSVAVKAAPKKPDSQVTTVLVSAAPAQQSKSAVTEPTLPATPAVTASAGGRLNGVTYSPYTSTGNCKSAAQVDADFSVFASSHGVVRLYGVDCDQVASGYAAAKKYGNKLFLGIFNIDAVQTAVSTIASGVKNDWSIVDTVSVGNELVNNGAKSPAAVIAAAAQARQALRAAGYRGPVVIVDTFVAAIKHPELCDESDYCAVNVHPFFDPNTGASQAGTFVTTQIQRLRSQLADSNKRIVVTETGWPWKGDPNGAAVPGLGNQATALSSIQNAFSSNPADCILFTAFNDLWKQAAASTFNAEQFWGMGGHNSVSDS